MKSRVEASTTKVSSKGQGVIPVNVRKATGLKEGEKVLAIAVDDTVLLKKITAKTFEDTIKPVWDRLQKLGLTEKDVDAIIKEARLEAAHNNKP